MKEVILNLETLTCPSCVVKLERAFVKQKGVEHDTIHVGFNSSTLRFKFDPEMLSLAEIKQRVEAVGFVIKKTTIR